MNRFEFDRILFFEQTRRYVTVKSLILINYMTFKNVKLVLPEYLEKLAEQVLYIFSVRLCQLQARV